jgi:hypothetical protein
MTYNRCSAFPSALPLKTTRTIMRRLGLVREPALIKRRGRPWSAHHNDGRAMQDEPAKRTGGTRHSSRQNRVSLPKSR